jgi:hypothetical protein
MVINSSTAGTLLWQKEILWLIYPY